MLATNKDTIQRRPPDVEYPSAGIPMSQQEFRIRLELYTGLNHRHTIWRLDDPRTSAADWRQTAHSKQFNAWQLEKNQHIILTSASFQYCTEVN